MDSHQHILLTGGTGFFGRSLLRVLLSEFSVGGQVPSVTALSRSPERFLELYPEFSGLDWLQFSQGDVCCRGSLHPAGRFTHVLHAATDSTLGPSLPPLQRYLDIVDGTRNLLEFAVERKIPRFLLTSSGAIYGPQPPNLRSVGEEYPGSPSDLVAANAYAMGKRAAEYLCALFRDTCQIETVIARCFAFVGPDLPLDAHFAAGNFVRDAIFRDAIEVKSDGTALRTYLYQDDLAHWLIALMERGKAGESYNVGSGEAVSVLQLAHLVRDTLAPGKTVDVRHEAKGSVERNMYVPDIGKARSQMGLSVTVPLEEAIRRTGEFHRARHKC